MPKKVLKKVELVPVDHMDEVLQEALVVKQGETIFASEKECEPFCIDSAQAPETTTPEVTAH